MKHTLDEILHDPRRLAAVRRVALADAAAETAFDRLSSLVTRILRVPVALVTLVEEDRQLLKGCVGLPEPWASARETPLSHSFCQYTLGMREALVVEDARRDPRLADNLAIPALSVVAYAGIPLITSQGHALGALCAIDNQPRSWSQEEIGILRDLAASAVTEIELREAAYEIEQEQRRRSSLLESTDEGIFGMDGEGRCTFLNRAGAEMLGYTPGEVLGARMHALIHHTRADGTPYPPHQCPVTQTLRTGRAVRIDEDTLWRKDGTPLPVSYSSFPVREGEAVTGAVVTFIDLTQRMRTEAELRLRERAIGAISEGIFITDPNLPDNPIIYANRGAERLTGYPAAEMIGRNCRFMQGPETDRGEVARLREAIERVEPCAVEFINYRKDGTTYWNALSVSPVHDPAGRLTHFVGVQKDVTERKRIEVELRDREERYRLVSRATNDVIWDWDMTTGELQWNEAVASTFGYPAGTMPSRIEWWYEQIHPDDRDRVVSDIHAAIDEGEEAWTAEYRFRRRDGEYASVLDRGVVARLPDGRALRMIGSMMDVTEDRWRAETQQFLAEASRALGASLDYGTALRAVCDLAVPRMADFCAVYLAQGEDAELEVLARHVDPDAEEALREHRVPAGGSPPLLAMRGRETVHNPEVSPRAEEPVACTSSVAVPLIARGLTLGALWVGTCESRRRFTLADVATFEDLAGRIAVAVDNAALFAAEQRARTEAEIASQAKSDFVAAMSHELRTPLNATLGYGELMEMGVAGPVTGSQREYLARIRASNQHLLGLIEDVLDFSKVEAGRMTVVRERGDAAGVVANALALVEPQARAKEIRIANRLAPGREYPYVGDEDRVRQVLVNLLSNAVKFTEPGGEIVVEVGVVSEADPEAHPAGRGPWTCIRVHDNGIGIAPEKLEAVFQPFVQAETGHTRTAGGTGLGLTISREFARLMGGDLSLRSVPGEGSCFTLWLSTPAAAAEPEAVASVARVGELLQRALDALVAGYVARMRADPAIPEARELSRVDLEDHTAAFLAALAQALVILDEAGESDAESHLLRDSADFRHMLSARHGVQRARLGWTEHALRREYEILTEEIRALVRRGVPPEAARATGALDAVTSLLAQAEASSLAGFHGRAGGGSPARAPAGPDRRTIQRVRRAQ
ncbi:MAG TPA: PAS domain S-box protein [Longimicrobium sp.]|jgi:PAS domain S-box-containing protein